MMKWTMENGQWKIIIVLIAFLLSIVNSQFLTSPVYAVDSTPSADIKAKLEQLKKEIASKAALLKQEITKKLSDKAYIGKVSTKTDASLTITTISGLKNIKINQDTIFESNIKAKTKFSIKTLSPDDYIAALGDIDESEVLIAKKIVLLPPPAGNAKTVLWGQIISSSDKLLTLKDKDLKTHAVSIEDLKSAKLNDFVIITGILGKNDIFQSKFVHTIPQGMIRSQKIATPSATLRASPSAVKK